MTYGARPARNRLSRLLAIFVSILLVGCAATGKSSAPEQIGMVKVRTGDDPLRSLVDYDDSGWESRPTREVDTQRQTVWIRTHVRLGPSKAGDRPLAVHVSALAAYEVFWNGALIGRSGSPGSTAETERQGEVDGHFAIPPDLARPGDNLLAMRLSTFHLPMRVKHSLLQISVGDHQAGSTQALRGYAAAIIAAGVLLLGGAYFGFAYRANRTDRASLLLALLSLVLLLQLSLEVSRAFVGYPYGLHLWRVGAIFALASSFGVLLVAYVRREFRPEGGRWLTWATLLWCPAAFLLFEGFDDKTYVVILGSAAVAAAGVVPAALKGSRPALLMMTGTSAMALPLLGVFPAFLDQDFYLIASALITGLCLQRRPARPFDPAIAAAPTEGASRDARIPLLSARGVQLCDPRSFLMIKGADDYAEVVLADGSSRLHRGRLTELEARLPHSFLRVHRSYIVNMDRAIELSSASGSLRIRLEVGGSAPVSRTYTSSVRARFLNQAGGPAPIRTMPANTSEARPAPR